MFQRICLRFGFGAGVIVSLACGGFSPFGTQGTRPVGKPNPDITDMAERARLEGDYQRAEAMLRARIKKDPADHHAHRLLGDVNLTRALFYRKVWKPNLSRAYDSYAKAVSIDPTNCRYWGRLGSAATMAAMNDETRIPASSLAGLPLDQGREHCKGPAVHDLAMLLQPSEEQLEAAKKAAAKNASRWDVQAAAAPWQKTAWDELDLSAIRWTEGAGPPKVRDGGTFVVLEPPTTASGVGHDFSRPVEGMETFVAGRVSGSSVTFTDRKFPKKLPRDAMVLVNACSGSTWKENIDTGAVTGRCSAGSFQRGASQLFAPEILQIAGPNHYVHESVRRAVIPTEDILFESIRCLGGALARKYDHTPLCPVAYDKPNWLTRSIPLSKAVGARGQDHAEHMMEASGMVSVWGPELTERVIRGDIGVGMPYSLFARIMPDTRGCRGRGILARHVIHGGEVEFTCLIGEQAFTFVDLQLVWFGDKAEYTGEAVAVDDEE